MSECYLSRPVRVVVASILISVLCQHPLVFGAGRSGLVVLPEKGNKFSALLDDQPYLDMELVAWEENWKYLGFRGSIAAQDGSSVLTNHAQAKGSGADVTATLRVAKTGPRRLTVDALVQASKDTALTYIVLAVDPVQTAFDGGTITATPVKGKRRDMPLPLGRQEIGTAVDEISLVDGRKNVTRISMDPARDISADGAIRIVLAAGVLRAGQPQHTTLTFEFPAAVTYFAGAADVPPEPGFAQWYPFQPDDDYSKPSEIGMEGWLDAPAGKYGRIVRRNDQLLYHEQPIKLWGVNICYSACAPDESLAEKRAHFYAHYGINAVRLHKYADGPGWSGIQSADSFVRFDPEGLKRMDYQVAQLKRRGIYVELSTNFGSQKLGPADKQFVPYLHEFGSFSGRNGRVTTPHSAVHYSPELQDVQIRQMVNLMHHKNPYTGLTYVEDPVIAFVEIINEQSILFYTSMKPLEASPTLRRYVARRFCTWLRAKYGSQKQLVSAWGEKALDSFADEAWVEKGESLDKDNILPLGNPWYWDPAQLDGSQLFQRQRLLDTLQFLYELQNEFYSRYVQAMREAGYAGEVVSSNWQAGRALSHFCNLHSDALVGTVDRHNYFGGGDQSRINNATMLAVPGSGTLSAGMQQVADRPFMLSEWIHVQPNEWGVEGPAIIGAYGLGLQGWDVSFMFQNRDAGAFSQKMGGDRWDVMTPNVLGVFPAVARQVLRGDVTESKLQAHLNVNVPTLLKGKVGFEDKVTQQYDVKTFSTDKVPAAALSVARCSVRFTDQFEDTPVFNVSRYVQSGIYVSSTKQLRWRAGQNKLDGSITINTPGTQAVVGFANGQTCKLNDVTIQPDCRYAAIYVSAQERQADLASAKGLIVVAIARARNSGAKLYHEDRILNAGQPPIVMEPVKAKITLHRRGVPTVYLLDHNGRRTDRTLPLVDGQFEIDGARDRTCYYLVRYPEK